MSRYDYSDPGQDSTYCDELASDEVFCLWCDNPMGPEHGEPCWPYCSTLCAAQAERDSEEDEVKE
jgi:hypothetical protein